MPGQIDYGGMMSQTSKAFGIVQTGAHAAVTGSRLFQLRPMREQDLRAVMLVERAAYEFPWTGGIFRDCLRVGYDCRIIEIPQDIIGHGVMSVAAGECHLLNICVHPRYQRRGL